MMLAPGHIAQQSDRLVEVANHQINSAIVIQVTQGESPAKVILLEIGPPLGADVSETSASQVAHQNRPLTPMGRPEGKAALVPIDEDEVLPAVMVQIEKSR